MPQVPLQIIEEIKARIDIAEIIGERMTLKRESGGWKGLCPFHNEKTPSFHVNMQRQRYHCFGCGKDGDVIGFLVDHDGMTFNDAVKYLGDKCGVEIQFEKDDRKKSKIRRLYLINSEAAAYFHRCLLQIPQAEVAREYARRRKLTDEIIEKFELGFDPDIHGSLDAFAAKKHFTRQEMIDAGIGAVFENSRPGDKLYDRFRGRLMFPIKDHQGRTVAFSARILTGDKKAAKYVNSPETEVFKKSHVLYALDKAQRAIAASKHREAILCEGQIDVIRCHACGFPRAVASEGTAFTEEHAKLLHRYADSVVELFDADNAGRKAAVRTAAILLAKGMAVRIARIPDGKDPDEFLLSHTQEEFQQILDSALGVVQFHIQYLSEQERDPGSPDALGRIVDEVLHTVAACANQIHKARMKQEVADILKLPESVINERLAGIEETIKRQQLGIQRRAIERENLEAERIIKVSAPTPVSSAPASSAVEQSASQQAASSVQSVPSSTPIRKDIAAASPLDISMCEFLIQNASTAPGFMKMMSQCVPPYLFKNEIIRKIIEAFYASIGSEGDPVQELQERNSDVAELLGNIAMRPNRTGSSSNFATFDVAVELMLGVWRRNLQERIDESRRSGDNSPDAIRNRMRYQKAITELRSWNRTSAYRIFDLAGLDAKAVLERFEKNNQDAFWGIESESDSVSLSSIGALDATSPTPGKTSAQEQSQELVEVDYDNFNAEEEEPEMQAHEPPEFDDALPDGL